MEKVSIQRTVVVQFQQVPSAEMLCEVHPPLRFDKIQSSLPKRPKSTYPIFEEEGHSFPKTPTKKKDVRFDFYMAVVPSGVDENECVGALQRHPWIRTAYLPSLPAPPPQNPLE